MLIIMYLEQLKKLQQELLGIIFLILAPDSAEEEKDMKDQALEIIGILKDHINDDIEMNNLRMTILDWIIFCDSQDNVRLNNRSLLDLEDAVKSIGGKTSQELGKHSGLNIDNLLNRLIQVLINTGAGVLAASSIVYVSNQGVQRPEIVGAILGGLLITPTVLTGSLALSRLGVSILENRGVQYIEPRRLLLQSFREIINTSSVGLSAALGAGIITLLRARSEATLSGENIAFSLISGTGAALSTALVKRAFAPVSTNLENVVTEQQNIQEQNI
ncbi:hypothetical protein WSTR_05000 [Wolbachia endosymbiont of Laodelphax striatellus]|uniref:hypothetical protein n=1 Tax=Wolbachia endosymbiont of Laodelphax striatellus TaxID=368602 RepID=UPI0007C45355|nr:hypothetical protein WSTR_05000 [Wolbachia endosymbiont of Laodelphax striatellus]